MLSQGVDLGTGTGRKTTKKNEIALVMMFALYADIWIVDLPLRPTLHNPFIKMLERPAFLHTLKNDQIQLEQKSSTSTKIEVIVCSFI